MTDTSKSQILVHDRCLNFLLFVLGLISDVDLRSRENNSAHHTREIDQKRLIVRRGQPFSITLQCNGTLRPRHHLDLVLHLGKRDEVEIKVQKERGAGDKWWFNQQGAQDEMLLTLHSPADAIIGRYSLAVLLMSPDGRILEKKDKMSFHLLYNPWCKDDVVYLPDETQLQEYIMNEDGIIYMGTWEYIKSTHWNYGQFEDYVMDICFEFMLAHDEPDLQPMNATVEILSLIGELLQVNSNDDRGVLTGRWTEPYSDGVAPYQWTGSVPILRQWSKAGVRAVKYGQCWVFAAVACTVLRCLGIPTRLITNFSSAHDVDGNLSIDFLLDENLQPLESRGGRDSSWNFHFLDPTLKNSAMVLFSFGVFRCGPCPVTAIKEGNLGVKYDTPFVFAEVNADIIHWIVQRNGQRRKVLDHATVGRNISTKSVYGDFRDDVTLHYKYPEGYVREGGRRVTDVPSESSEPGRLQLSIKHAKPVFGTDFDVIIEVKNEGDQDAHVQLTMLAMARQTTTVMVPAHKVTQQEVLRLRYDDYAQCVSDDHLIRVKAFVEAPGENEPLLTVTDIPLSRPEVFIQVGTPVGAFVCEQVKASISFTNPLPVPLKGGVFTLEGAGLLSSTKIHVSGDISPGQTVSIVVSFSPMRTGVRKLLVDFDSDRLKDVKGVTTVVESQEVQKYLPEITECY
uniref:Transglutaminase-like domain-containing protein n=1 Tax=Oreochromis aureus TaxID=47969 RepID=A0A668T956_OREAU